MKHYFMALLAATALTATSCKDGKQNATDNGTDSTTTEQTAQKKTMDAKTFFTAIHVGMSELEVNDVLATYPEEGLEWEGLHIKPNPDEFSYNPDGILQSIYFRSEAIGTGEYCFAGSGTFKLFEEKEDAVSYQQLGAKLERFANFVSETTGGFTADCSMQSFSFLGDELGCGTIMMDYHVGEGREIPGQTDFWGDAPLVVHPVRLSFYITTPENYAN